VPNSNSAKKRLRQNAKCRDQNKGYKSKVATQVKKFETALAAGDAEAAKAEFLKAAKVLDTVAGRGIIHKNLASRKKSRMQSRLHNLAAAPAQSTETKSEEGAE